MAELVVIYDQATGGLFSKKVGSAHIASGAIVSGAIASGALVSGLIQSGQLSQFVINDPQFGRGATVIVATNDSLARSKAQADFLGDGASDDMEITSALAALPSIGGVVALAEGSYDIRSSIVIPRDNIGIYIPPGATLKLASGRNTPIIFEPATPRSQIRIWGGGTLDGNDLNNTMLSSKWLVTFSRAGRQRVIEGLRFINCGYQNKYPTSGEGVISGWFGAIELGGQGGKVINCFFDAVGYAADMGNHPSQEFAGNTVLSSLIGVTQRQGLCRDNYFSVIGHSGISWGGPHGELHNNYFDTIYGSVLTMEGATSGIRIIGGRIVNPLTTAPIVIAPYGANEIMEDIIIANMEIYGSLLSGKPAILMGLRPPVASAVIRNIQILGCRMNNFAYYAIEALSGAVEGNIMLQGLNLKGTSGYILEGTSNVVGGIIF